MPRHTCSRSHITHSHKHVCAWMCTCVHTDTATCAHTHTHTSICMHTHDTRLYSMCIPVHMHRLPPTCMHTHTYPHAHRYPYAHTHTLAHTGSHIHARVHTRTCTHCTSCCRPCFSHHHEECDVSESLLTLLPLLQPCSRPDRDVVRRGRPAPGQYLELLSSVAC